MVFRMGMGKVRAPSRGLFASGVRLVLLASALALAACSHMPSVHWPWAHRPAPPPEVVHELVVTASDGGSAPIDFPQYWKRNTLVLDLQGVSGTGGVVLRPKAGTVWPVRLAFRVSPGAIGQLEVRADQRLVIPVTTEGAKPVDLELAPGVYTATTGEIRVNWAPGGAL